MGLIDKIKNTFFSEVDVYDETNMKDTSFDYNKEKKETKKSELKRNVETFEKKVVSEKISESKPIAKESKLEEIKKSFDITVDKVKEKKAIKQPIFPSERNVYNIPQVISPIHGAKEDIVKSGVEATPPTKVSKRVIKDPLGTIISPFHGNEEEIEEKLATDDGLSMSFASSILEDEEINEDIENISLDQMVEINNNEEKEIIQFSLLGDATSLKHISEEEDDGDESLPF
ncbi:MAG: hypothetical protein ACK5KR_08375 [Breznakia sp.]